MTQNILRVYTKNGCLIICNMNDVRPCKKPVKFVALEPGDEIIRIDGRDLNKNNKAVLRKGINRG